MSLINDALKRAKEGQPGNTPAPNAPMQPVNQQPRSAGLPIFFLPVLLATVCGAGLFLWNGWETKTQQSAARPPLVVQAREARVNPDPEAPLSPDSEEPGIPVGRNFSLEDDTPHAVLLAEAGALPPSASLRDEPPKAAVSTFKLQGIFYRAANPSAVINTKTVFVGDHVANGRVKSISRDTVTLDCDGETKVLTFR
jgi:hypothetical protein